MSFSEDYTIFCSSLCQFIWLKCYTQLQLAERALHAFLMCYLEQLLINTAGRNKQAAKLKKLFAVAGYWQQCCLPNLKMNGIRTSRHRTSQKYLKVKFKNLSPTVAQRLENWCVGSFMSSGHSKDKRIDNSNF